MTSKQKAGFKIAYGVTRCVSAGMLATGHGLLAIVIRKRSVQLPVAHKLLKAGQETLQEGLAEWKASS